MDWSQIDWTTAERRVQSLRFRIFRAACVTAGQSAGTACGATRTCRSERAGAWRQAPATRPYALLRLLVAAEAWRSITTRPSRFEGYMNDFGRNQEGCNAGLPGIQGQEARSFWVTCAQ